MAYSNVENHNPIHVNAALDAVFEPIRVNIALVVGLFRTWAKRERERQQLARLSDRELGDMGITRASAAYEFEKPFWRD